MAAQSIENSFLRIRRVLLTVSDKAGVAELGRALHEAGAELVATGRTASVLKDAGLPIVPIEAVSGSPEAFQGRMKTLSYNVCSGILYRRGDGSDEADLKRLAIAPIDCVVVNFYPFEDAARRARTEPGFERKRLIEEIDIGGPTLVRAAAKNSPDVLVLTDPAQYAAVIADLRSRCAVSRPLVEACAAQAWERIYSYDRAITREMGAAGGPAGQTVTAPGAMTLRYGENPHQRGWLECDSDSPIAWEEPLTPTELSYNNILDLSAAYALAGDLAEVDPAATGVVIVKHNNPCGVALVPKARGGGAQLEALSRAWEGDPVSAFGGVLVFTDPVGKEAADFLAERFVELIAAPGLSAGGVDAPLARILAKRKNLKAVAIRRFGGVQAESVVAVPGGRLHQTTDLGLREELVSKTRAPWPADRRRLGLFGIACCRALKSNSIAIVREIPGSAGSLQLVGAGQGQPNRVEALEKLAIPRAKGVIAGHGGSIGECVMVSDAFFPFRDTVDTAHAGGLRFIIQPGGSIKDRDSIAACDEHGIAMAFTGVRHFRH